MGGAPPPPVSGPPMGGVGGGQAPPQQQAKTQQPLGAGGPPSARGAQFFSVGGGGVPSQPTQMQVRTGDVGGLGTRWGLVMLGVGVLARGCVAKGRGDCLFGDLTSPRVFYCFSRARLAFDW